MSEPQVLDADRFDDLVRRLADLTWPLSADDARGLVGQWGWTLQEEIPVGSLVVDPGFGFGGGWPGAFHVAEGAVTSVFVRASDHVSDPSPKAARVMLAAYGYFADRIASVVGEVGTERDQVGFPEAAWTLPSGAELVLTRDPEACALRVAAPAAAEPEPEPEPVAEPAEDPAVRTEDLALTEPALATAPAEEPAELDEPADADGWDAVAEAFVPTLAGLEDRARVILTHVPGEAADGDYYLQLAVDAEHGLTAEAVADHFLPEPLRIGEDGATRMRELGWSDPVPAGEWLGNWAVTLPFPPPPQELPPLASLLVATLRDVFGATSPSVVSYEAWRDSAPDGSEPRQPLFLSELESAGLG